MIFKTRSALVRYKKCRLAVTQYPPLTLTWIFRKLVGNSLLWKPANFDSGCSFHSDFVHDCREVLHSRKEMEKKITLVNGWYSLTKKPWFPLYFYLISMLLVVFDSVLRAKVLTCSPWLSTGHHSIAHTLGNIFSRGAFQRCCLLLITPNILSMTPSK